MQTDEAKKEKVRANSKIHYKNNRDLYAKRDAARWNDPERRAKVQAYQRERYIKHKMMILSHYSPDLVCAYCGEDWFPCLTIDHINGDGHKGKGKSGRRYNGIANLSRLLGKDGQWPDDLQVLCQSCNSVKRTMTDKEFRQAYPERIHEPTNPHRL